MRKIAFMLLALAIGLLLAACSAPADSADCANLPANGPKIHLTGAWSRAAEMGMPSSLAAPAGTPMGTPLSAAMGGTGTSAVYLVISNCGAEADALLSAASDVAATTGVHVTETKNSVTMMTEVQRIDIPAGKKVELKEGGYHIMLMDLKQNIKPGDPVEITLTFEKAGSLKVTAPARSP